MKRFFADARVLLACIAAGLAPAERGLAQTTITDYSGLKTAVSAGGRSVFASNATVTFSGAAEVVAVKTAVVLDGSTNADGSTNTVTITRASGIGPMFYIYKGGSLTLVNLTISDGLNTNGGAIYNDTGGTLIVSNCVFTGNTATNVAGVAGVNATTTGSIDGGNGGNGSSAAGGAIVSHGTLKVYYSVFENNSVSAGSGGNGGNGIQSFVFGGNGGSAGSGGSAEGGAIVCTGATNIFVATDFTGNKCTAGNAGAPGTAAAAPFPGNPGSGGIGGSSVGGAIVASGSLFMSNCLLANNSATGGSTTSLDQAGGSAAGGGLELGSSKGAVIIENTTFYQNSCEGGAGGGNSSLKQVAAGNGGAAIGGGLADGATLTILTNCTLATNSLKGGAAGVSTTMQSNGLPGLTLGFNLAKTAGTLEMGDCLLAGGSNSIATNTSAPSLTTYVTNTQPNDYGGVKDLGYNLSSDTSVALSRALGSIENKDPIIDSGLSTPGGTVVGLLNGSVASTLAVLSGSPAIVPGIPGIPGISFPAYDQTFQLRSTPTTIGAYEANPLDLTVATIAAQLNSPTNWSVVTNSGQKVVFKLVTNALPIAMGFQWRFHGTNLVDSKHISGALSDTLTIGSVTAADEGVYTLLAGYSALVSNGIVTNTATLAIYIPASITVEPPKAATLAPGMPVNMSVTATGDAPLFYQWYQVTANQTNALSDTNFGITGSASSTLTIYPVSISNFGSYFVVVSNAYPPAATSSSVSLSAPPPTLSIHAPPRTVTNAVTNLTGTALGNFGVTNVNYQINNGGWMSAVITKQTNWSATVTLQGGPNMFSAYSVDSFGQPSKTNSVTVFYTTYSALTLRSTGFGTISSNFTKANLVVGSNYTVKAVPNSNNLFLGWTGTITNSSNPLTFVMQSNMTLTANFIANFFPSFAGTYNGLFSTPNGVAEESAGMISGLTVNSSGGFSGKVFIAGITNSFSGNFNAAGQASISVGTASGKGGAMVIELTLEQGLPKQITGTVSSHAWVAPLTIEPAAANQPTDRYTMLFSNATGAAPPGEGYAWVSNNAGRITLFGALADGTAFSQTVPVSATGDVPVYASLYKNTGLVLGWVNLNSLDSSTPTNELTWIAPAGGTKLYPAGLTNRLTVQGAVWTPPPANTPAVSFTNELLVVSNSALSLTYGVALSSSNTLTTPANSLTGFINRTNGLFSVTISNGIGHGVTKGSGAILQTSGSGAGFFTNSTGAGLISLQPALVPVVLQSSGNQIASNKPVEFSVNAIGAPPLSYQWMMDGTNLANGGNVSGATNSQFDISNPVATDLGSYSVVVSNQYGSVTSSVAILSIPPPTLSIKAPPSTVTSGVTNVTGTALGNFGVTNVYYEINSGGWMPADITQQPKWSATVTLQAGSNTFSAYSVDPLGQTSAITNVTIFYTTYSQLTLQTNGFGTISHSFSSLNLVVGSNYTVMAIPNSGNLFSNWTGTIASSSNPLMFVMQSNMTLTANFVTNLFPPVQTTYNGLFSTSNGVTEETAGMLSGLTLTPTGFFSGKLFIAGTTNRFSGNFSAAGQASVNIGTVSAAVGALVVDLIFEEGATNQIVGTVSNVSWVAPLTIEQASTNQPTNQYTMLFSNVSGITPPGEGYAWISNNAGTAWLVGALADGTPFSQGISVSQFGDIPVYASLYNNTGLLIGWVNLTNMGASPPINTLTWIEQSSGGASLYPDGFTNTLSVQGSPWTMPPANTAAINMTKGDLLVTNTSSNLDFTVAVLANNTLAKLGGDPPNSLTGSINRTNGLFSVTFGYGAGTVKGYGAILQSQTNGGGYFQTATNAGELILQP